MKIGFIGLGIMGKPMAKNLVKAGYEVIVADKFAPKNVEEVVAAGAKAAASNQEVGSQVDVLITMVPNSPNVKEALFGEDGAAKTMKKMFESSKNIRFTDTTVKIFSALSDENRAQIEAMADELLA